MQDLVSAVRSPCVVRAFQMRSSPSGVRGLVAGAPMHPTMTRDLGEHQPSLWQDRVLLDEDFYRALREHPVPVSEAGLRAIGPKSMVIGVYVWLAYRLHALKREVEVGWPALHAQFGMGFTRMRAFRGHFLDCLAIATAAYPDARIALGDRGVILHPSRPAVLKLA
jgi:hypothetical protein